MKQRRPGSLAVSELGFGTMSFAATYGASPARAEAIRVIRGAHDLGVSLFDTAEAYGPWTNEELVGEALRPIRDQVVIATKFGFDIDPGTGRPVTNVLIAGAHGRVARGVTVICPACGIGERFGVHRARQTFQRRPS